MRARPASDVELLQTCSPPEAYVQGPAYGVYVALPGLQFEWPTADHVSHQTETAPRLELNGRAYGIAHGQAK
jgi:hypothetical protein